MTDQGAIAFLGITVLATGWLFYGAILIERIRNRKIRDTISDTTSRK